MSLIRRLYLAAKSVTKSTARRIEDIAAEEELRAARSIREPGSKADTRVNPSSSEYRPEPAPAASDSIRSHYGLLGIEYGASLDEVEAAWRQLSARSDPKRFPPGSEEEKRAARLLSSLNEAYAAIREHLNPTEGRFGRLEL